MKVHSVSQKIYWWSPYFVKELFSWQYAWKMDRLRHGYFFEQTLREITERDKWTSQQFLEFQNEQLRLIVRHAASYVPYYRKVFSEYGINPNNINSIEDMKQLPILDKELVRADPKSFLDERLNPGKLSVGHTSGTTGTPLTIYRDVSLDSTAFAYCAARWHRVAGMQRRINHSVSIGGRLVTAPWRTKPPFWVYNKRWDQLYMSSYHLSPRHLGYYVEKLRKFKADYIEGYPSSIYSVASYIIDKGLEPVSFGCCFTTAEMLFDYQRQAIKKAFCCRTYNQYGCGEQVVFATECKEGSMHLSPEVGIVEVVDDNDNPVPCGRLGNLICTSLVNKVQPFIRYRIGDVGSLGEGRCSCGSPLPVLKNIEGRSEDVLITSDGRRVGRLDHVVYGIEGISLAQIVQEDYDRFCIRLVPSKEYNAFTEKKVIESLATRIGKANIRVELVDEIERTSAGKFQAVICKLNKKSFAGQ
jgi:phenylacetate-CoA ligase